MSPAQINLYFREWGAVRKHYTSTGIDPKLADSKRHELHRRALGCMKSSKDFTNADLDKVLGVFRAITSPADLGAQLRQLDQSEERAEALIGRARDLAARCVSRPGLEGTYLDGLARKIFGGAQGYRRLSEKNLAALCGILQRRIAQLTNPARARGKQAPGELAAACQAETAKNPF
ncbi:MAG: hypothetical protein Q8J78_13920 [Moraxellaceae bacterium]|nr:hypothetical protein [Moraxellaceae bacterium]